MPAHNTATGASGAASVHKPADICCNSCEACCCGAVAAAAPEPAIDLLDGCRGLPSFVYTGSDVMSRWLLLLNMLTCPVLLDSTAAAPAAAEACRDALDRRLGV